MIDELMRKAIDLSLNGGVDVYPNPMVGCVIFDDDFKIISTGYHKKFGGDHAEVDALKKISQ